MVATSAAEENVSGLWVRVLRSAPKLCDESTTVALKLNRS